MAISNNRSQPEENKVQMVSLILIFIILIFYSDISTPLGLMTGILYFIPIMMTLYIRYQNGPFVVSGISIILLWVGYLLSPRDMSEFYALANRAFFSILLIVLAIMIWRNKIRESTLQRDETRLYNIVESSPMTICIFKDGDLQFVNTAGIEFFTVESSIKSIDELLNCFNSEDREVISSSIPKAREGARIELSELRWNSGENGIDTVDLWIGEITWDGSSAIQVILNPHSRI